MDCTSPRGSRSDDALSVVVTSHSPCIAVLTFHSGTARHCREEGTAGAAATKVTPTVSNVMNAADTATMASA
jgi:hypothetical protein